MKPENIIREIASLGINKNLNILDVFKKAFDEDDLVLLFRLRASMVEELKCMLESLDEEYKNITAEQKKAVDQVCMALGYKNLDTNMAAIAPLLAVGNVAVVDFLYSMNKMRKDYLKSEEISVLNAELKELLEEEELLEDEREVVCEIVEDIDDALIEFKVRGTRSIRKLNDILIGKAVLHSKTIAKIKSKNIKDKIKEIYENVDLMNKVADTIISIASKSGKVLELFG